MFRIRKLWLILTFAILGLLAGATIPSFAYLYDGIHWADGDLPVTWEINQNGTADCTGEFDAVRTGYQTWDNVSGSYFTETYVGTSTRGLGYDGHNVVSWGDSESGTTTLAVCWTWYQPSTLTIVECDIEFQNDYTWSSTGEVDKYDVQNIATHEFGHTLNLWDLYGSGDTEKTMYGYASLGETKKRSLHQDDIDGICYIYPKPNQPPNVPSSPTGPDAGIPGSLYTFTATTSDPDGDQVAFKFGWGDVSESGWTSYVDSGSSASKSHSWSAEGTFYVKVKAKDIYNAESGWSAGHPITIRAAVLEVDPSSLDFGEVGKSSTKKMTFRAYNAGGGTLSGTISANRNWITVSPTSFEGNDNTISVTVGTEGLTESRTPYTGTITVASNGGTKTIEVFVIVIPTGVVVYPNPFSLSRHTNLTFWGTGVPHARIRIFILAGELVETLDEKYGVSEVSWDGRNEKGDKVARGIYIYVTKDSTGKIAIIK